MSQRVSIGEWTPGLNDAITLRAAYASMPGDDATAIPWYVRLLENPGSPVALPGAVDMFGHDCIHILLGRGKLPQDEAFVVGFTMGASGRLARWQRKLFTLCARYFYRSFYRFSKVDRLVYDRAVDFATRHQAQPVHDVAWRDMLHVPLGEVRASLGIDMGGLIDVYEGERRLFPTSAAASRLPQAATTGPRDPGASARMA